MSCGKQTTDGCSESQLFNMARMRSKSNNSIISGFVFLSLIFFPGVGLVEPNRPERLEMKNPIKTKNKIELCRQATTIPIENTRTRNTKYSYYRVINE